MKRSLVKKICAAVFVIAAILMILILSLNQKEQMPQFKFLKGNAPFICIEESKSIVIKTHYIYSFEVDCNDIMAFAIEELNDMDYQSLHSPICDMVYSSTDYKYGDSTFVEFYKNYKLIEMSETYNNTILNPFLHKELCCDGWISIRITKHKKQNKLIFEFKQFLQELRGSK